VPGLTKHLIVHGRVQGVGYRDAMVAEALRLRITGWVRNRTGGTVEAMVHGEPEAVAQMLEWARCGPRAARVTHVVERETGEVFQRFERLPSA
jgi:acylphosphatase